MTKQQMKNALLKEKEDIENNISYYREMISETTDISTKEMYQNSLEYARGRWYGIYTALLMMNAD